MPWHNNEEVLNQVKDIVGAAVEDAVRPSRYSKQVVHGDNYGNVVNSELVVIPVKDERASDYAALKLSYAYHCRLWSRISIISVCSIFLSVLFAMTPLELAKQASVMAFLFGFATGMMSVHYQREVERIRQKLYI